MQKRNKMCPMCYLRRLFLGAPAIENPSVAIYENNTGKTPLMGWSSWNTFRNRIDEQLILDTAAATKEKGLLDAGYRYVNLDDNWHSNMRDEHGDLQGELVRFANGIPALVGKLNAMGFKAGIYSSNGTLTCEDLPASLGRERDDARTFAKWGIEYLKYDFCHNVAVSKYAPLVYSIEISPKGSGKAFEYEVSNAVLKGLARRMKCEALPGGQYVSGLDEGRGSIVFDNVVVDADGEYILTVNIKKHGRYEKYLAVTVNGKACDGIEFPSQKKYNLTARFQTVVRLKAGRNSIELGNPVANSRDSAAILYRKMAYALKNASAEVAEANGTPEKPILFSICEWGFRKPWLWGATAGNMWRTTPDIRPVWSWIKLIYSRNVKLWKYASPGHFNDPDMLEVGNGKLTYEQNLSHFALWCMMSAPLVLGNDIRKITKPVLDIVANRELIAIDQDPLGKQAKRIRRGAVDVLARPLADGGIAVCFFNKTKIAQKSRLDVGKLYKDNYVAPSSGGSTIGVMVGAISIIAGEASLEGKKIVARIPADGVVVVKIPGAAKREEN